MGRRLPKTSSFSTASGTWHLFVRPGLIETELITRILPLASRAPRP
jgi:hypothetical protein